MKRLTALLVALTLLMCMLPSGVFAVSENAFTVSIVADKTVANPGDTINFSVVVQQTGKMTSFETTLIIPEGLTLVPGSMEAADMDLLGWDELDVTESALLVLGYGDAYTGTAPVTLATFQCTVDTGVSGNLTVTPDADPDITYAEDDRFELKTMTIVPAAIDVQIPVEGVTLDRNTLTLGNCNNTISLVATVTPANATNQKIIWTSSNPEIATVDQNGLITPGFNPGGVITITATAEDGGKTASCVVTIYCEHGEGDTVDPQSPSCTMPGNYAYDLCAVCGFMRMNGVWSEFDENTITIPALNHDFDEKIEDAAHLVPGSGADCQQAKMYYYDCSRCAVMGTTTWTSTTMGNHKMETVWTTENNKHYHKCSVAGCTYIEDEENCSGGTATCTAKAVCGTCGKEYGDMLDHDLTHYARNGADHTKPGNIEYWQCEHCDKYFSDASANNEITQADTVIAQIPHNHSTSWSKNDTQHWNECSCGDKINVYDHNYDNSCDTTCNTCGYVRTITHTWQTTLSYNAAQHWTECSVCHEKKDIDNHHGGTADCQDKALCDDCNQSYGSLTDCDFTAEKAESKYLVSAGTCKDAAVYNKSCTVCGKAGTATFTTAKNPDNHVGGTEIRGASAESCTVDGYTGDTHCKGCDAQLEKGQAIPATAHKTATAVPEEESTCKTNGMKAHFRCPICNKDYLEKTVAAVAQSADDLKLPLNAENHEGGTEVKDAAPATCTVPGYTGDTYCKGCTVKLSIGTAIPAEHKLDKVAADPATHDATGNIEHYACSVCEKLYNDDKATTELTETDVVVPKGEHSYGEWVNTDGENHWKECVCGNKIETAAHKDENADGKCDICGYNVDVSNDSNNPQTGDNSNIFLWFILLAFSACGLVATTAFTKKRTR